MRHEFAPIEVTMGVVSRSEEEERYKHTEERKEIGTGAAHVKVKGPAGGQASGEAKRRLWLWLTGAPAETAQLVHLVSDTWPPRCVSLCA